jgi:hypothetical protein
MKRVLWRGLLGVTMALALAGVSSCAASSTPTTPTTTPATTDTFSGTVAQLGSVTNVFKVSTAGTVTISLTSVAPLSTLALGVAVMTSDGTSCINNISQNTDARVGTTALVGTATAASYCVKVYDSGNIAPGGSSDYTVQVVHP